jgi:hypothetical protein
MTRKGQTAKARAMQSETLKGTERMENPGSEGQDGTGGGMTLQMPTLDEEEVRMTAYFLWEQDGRPEGRDEHYWWAALEKIARQKSAEALLQSNETGA